MDSKPAYLLNKGNLAQKRYTEFSQFRENLTILQASKNTTDQKLGEMMGLRPKRVGDYKLGRCHPTFDEIREIASFFEVTIDQLLYQKASITFEDKPTSTKA